MRREAAHRITARLTCSEGAWLNGLSKPAAHRTASRRSRASRDVRRCKRSGNNRKHATEMTCAASSRLACMSNSRRVVQMKRDSDVEQVAGPVGHDGPRQERHRVPSRRPMTGHTRAGWRPSSRSRSSGRRTGPDTPARARRAIEAAVAIGRRESTVICGCRCHRSLSPPATP